MDCNSVIYNRFPRCFLNKVFISSLVPRPFILTYFYGHEVNVEIYVDVVNKCVIFLNIRMKTGNDFNKHLKWYECWQYSTGYMQY